MKTVRIPGFVDVEPGTSDPDILHMQVRPKMTQTAKRARLNSQKSPVKEPYELAAAKGP